MNKKILSLFLSLSLTFTYTPYIMAQDSDKESANPLVTSTKSTLQKIKSVVSSKKFIIPATFLSIYETLRIYNTKFSKPRNPIENNIPGETNERVQMYKDERFCNRGGN